MSNKDEKLWTITKGIEDKLNALMNEELEKVKEEYPNLYFFIDTKGHGHRFYIEKLADKNVHFNLSPFSIGEFSE